MIKQFIVQRCLDRPPDRSPTTGFPSSGNPAAFEISGGIGFTNTTQFKTIQTNAKTNTIETTLWKYSDLP